MPEDLEQAEVERKRAVKRLILETPSWFYSVHELFRDTLNGAGFQVRWIERFPFHPVFQASVRRGTFPLSRDNREAAGQLRQLLAQAGIRIGRSDLSVTQSRNHFSVAFCYLSEEIGVFMDCETGRTGPGNYVQDELEVLREYHPQV